jgi:Polysaccharide pyruvyl transferase
VRLMHLANWGGRNIGNAALIYGLERTVKEDLGDVELLPEPWDEYTRGLRAFDERFVEKVNRMDGLIVGAAVSFDGNPQFVNTGFRFDLPLELWDRIEKPIVFYGLSYRSWPDKPYHNEDALRRALEHAAASEHVLFSVRGDGTKGWLEGILGREEPAIREVPDPAIFVPVEDAWHPELEDGKVNVLVALNVEEEPHRWGGPDRRRLRRGEPEWRRRRNRFLGELAQALERLGAEHDLNVIFVAHDTSDHWLSYELFALLPVELKLRCVFAPASLPVHRGRYFYDLYAKADLAMSMRIHSMNPCIGLGTPDVPLVSQGRMRQFMASVGLEDLTVDVSTPGGIYEAAAQALVDPDAIRARYAEVRERLRGETREFNRVVGEHLR